MTFGEAFAFEEENLSLVVGEDLDGERLDVFLAWKLTGQDPIYRH